MAQCRPRLRRGLSPNEKPLSSNDKHQGAEGPIFQRALVEPFGEEGVEKAIRFYAPGGPEVMRWETTEVGAPGPGEVRVRHVAVGLNFADTYFRSGLYPSPKPAGIGVEASGVVEAVGEGVANVAPGDRVAYTGSPLGAYSTARVMPAAPLVKLPDTIAFETAAAMMMR